MAAKIVNMYVQGSTPGVYDVAISDGDMTSPLTMHVSKLMAMTDQVRVMVNATDAGTYQVKMSLLNDTGKWALAPDASGAPGTYATSLTINSFPAYFWVKASSIAGEAMDSDATVKIKVLSNTDYVSLPSIGNTPVSIQPYDAANPSVSTKQISTWPTDQPKLVKSVTIYTKGTGSGALFVCGWDTNGNLVKQTTMTVSPARLATIDMLSATPYGRVTVQSWYPGESPIIDASGDLSNFVITSSPNPSEEDFDTKRLLQLIGAANFDAVRQLGLPGMEADFDTERTMNAVGTVLVDTLRTMFATKEASFDTKRQTSINATLTADTNRITGVLGTLQVDTQRSLAILRELIVDTFRKLVCESTLAVDTSRKLLLKSGTMLADTVRRLYLKPLKKNYYFIR